MSIVREPLTLFYNGDSLDRITSQVSDVKRIPSIQKFLLKVLNWYVLSSSDPELRNLLIFTYTHKIILGYKKAGDSEEAVKAIKRYYQSVSAATFSQRIQMKAKLNIELLKGFGNFYLKKAS